jgi:hypothetical protein
VLSDSLRRCAAFAGDGEGFVRTSSVTILSCIAKRVKLNIHAFIHVI